VNRCLARCRRQVAAAIAVAIVNGACIGRGDAPDARTDSGDSANGRLAHVNGASLDSTSQVIRPASAPVAASSAPANTTAANGSTPEPVEVDVPRIPDTARVIVTPNPTPNSASSTGVAPTPDELSALAASLVVPVAGVMPSELRGSFHAPRGGGRVHNAIDIPAPRGTPVISATGGRVLKLFSSKAGGLMVYAADPTERFILMYGHLDRYADGIKDGMALERGQTIGYVGTTGNAPPNVPHLHFAIARTTNVKRWWNGTPIDPAPLLKK
jgi:peptidoglycan LD-endopeptidase LytH